MTLSLPDWLAILALAVGVIGGVLGVIGIALTIWIYQKATEVNDKVIEQQTRIAETTGVLKTLVDGLLGTAWAHVARQNETMIAKLVALQAEGEKAVATPERTGSVEDLETRVKMLSDFVLKLSDFVVEDSTTRRLPTTVPTVDGMVPEWARDMGLAGAMKRALERAQNSTVAPSDRKDTPGT